MKGKDEIPGIDIFCFPSMAAPFSSVDKGQVWLWDNYFCVFQKKPKTVYEAFQDSFPNKSEIPMGMKYHYAMTILHQSNPSPEPILVIGLEQLIFDNYKGDCFLGMFVKNKRLNYGLYNEDTDPEQIRLKFFDVIKQYLELDGQPTLIGTIPEIFPDTYILLNK